MKRFLIPILSFVASFALVFSVGKLAFGDTGSGSGSGSAVTATVTDAGSGSGSAVTATVTDAGSGSGSAVTAPSDKLHDPISQPQAAYDDLKAAKSSGWPVLLFAIALLVGRLLGKLGKTKSISWLAKLGTGKLAVGIAGGVAIAAAGYNAAFAHGSLFAILAAVIAAAMTAFNPHADSDDKASA